MEWVVSANFEIMSWMLITVTPVATGTDHCSITFCVSPVFLCFHVSSLSCLKSNKVFLVLCCTIKSSVIFLQSHLEELGDQTLSTMDNKSERPKCFIITNIVPVCSVVSSPTDIQVKECGRIIC
jgi:hypothetical protein